MFWLARTRKEYTAKEGHIYAMDTLNTPGIGRTVAKVLVVITIVSIIVLFLPWQQNIRGQGQLTALHPENRPQRIESAIAGRIAKWEVAEGDYVNKGDTILTLTEIKDKYFDPDLLLKIENQIEAKTSALQFKEKKREAYTAQIRALKNAMSIKLEQAENKLLQAKLKVDSDSLKWVASMLNNDNAESVADRNRKRYEAGNITLTKYQDLTAKNLEASAKENTAYNKFLESKSILLNAAANISGTQAEYLDKINKADSELNSSISDIFDAQATLTKLRNEFVNVDIRQQQYNVVSPQTGYLVKALKVGLGETIKEGEAVAIVMPQSIDRAVEMYVKAMDIPFISKGRKVRIQFDGWPALQFSGWQNVSVGTFGGVVEVIDAVNSKAGEFRILVRPDPDDEEWPEQLRIGSGIKGWVMLDDVPIWYEIWRQMNGFPPDVYDDISNASKPSTKIKKPKK